MIGCVLVLFLCFKQKAAYELRISDWSSDVCSSDLLRADLLLSQPAAGAALVDRLKERGLRMVVEKVEDEDALIEVMELGIDCAQGYQIGRASCRARVCQYV